ncbi:uncharacterized protein SPPG_05644 [Spizellomyces punctatus DAOM BR117]|uniref:Metal homeostatis protein bsd2 n=1 Tax=Spizellomyces punctatus (strain DAOM BR117) TaxID=645134 RepID=A0A0L0HEE6_SPIPD|nr:uncharacterized protein SPPG_05644 [Spizellomyces punctatus DAOM BR117]KNC99401.1 hypothetical protein SPPG_05644 [Spizellomyces punctatus DAOM BR117]|eukprot:XP_016607441.1 hypothetical protein SPPG_05644 [Spizellomyces punctatus DAOM BR117]
MPNYERVPEAEEESTSATPQQPPQEPDTSSSTPPTRAHAPLIRGNDGVFANLSAKPEVSAKPEGKTYQELEPPSYAEVAHDPVPSYYETTVISSGFAEDGEVLIEGLPVGDFFTFIVNMLVSMSFDFIGFLLTAMLATTHAARAGSRCGFGITLIRYGFYIKTRSTDEMIQYENETEKEREEVKVENDWVAYLMMFVGFFVILRANADFVRAKRMQAVILASSEVAPV